MQLSNLNSHIQELHYEALCLLNNSYPDFVMQSHDRELRNEIPVFVFHSIDLEMFESQLEYLFVNGYKTITADDFHLYITGKEKIPHKSILLAFDDGRQSFWKLGFPLLKKYGFKSVVFLIPGYIEEKTKKNKLRATFPGEALIDWQDIETMQNSGLVDFQSHTLYHHKVYSSDRIVGFLDESSLQTIYDQVVPLDFEENLKSSAIKNYFGLPIYESSSLMEGKPIYIDDPELRTACIQYYADNAWTSKSHAKANMKMPSFVKEFMANRENKGFYLSKDKTRKVILKNLEVSKNILESRLKKKITHLCYPNSLYSDLSTHLSKALGYVSNFCGCIPERKTNKSTDDPYRIVRLKNDFIFRLPGEGRKSLLSIIGRKFNRRLMGNRGF